jgi:hypothetical protein
MNPCGHRVAGISRQKIQIALKRISLQSCNISILGVKIANRLCADRGYLIVRDRGRRCIGAAIEKDKRRFNLRGIPRHLTSFGHFVDAQTNLVEHSADWQSARADHLSKGLGIRAVGSHFLRRHRARGGIESDQHALVRFD